MAVSRSLCAVCVRQVFTVFPLNKDVLKDTWFSLLSLCVSQQPGRHKVGHENFGMETWKKLGTELKIPQWRHLENWLVLSIINLIHIFRCTLYFTFICVPNQELYNLFSFWFYLLWLVENVALPVVTRFSCRLMVESHWRSYESVYLFPARLAVVARTPERRARWKQSLSVTTRRWKGFH